MKRAPRRGGSDEKPYSNKHRGIATVAAISCVLTFAGVIATVNTPKAAAVPPFPISDNTNGALGALDTNWQYRRSGSGNTGNTYTADGWLRLTNSGLTQATNILNNTAFPSSTGFQVSFDYRQAGGTYYNGQPGEHSGTGDGIAMYLIDGSKDISVGAAGSGLGYAAGGTGQAATQSQCSTPGVTGGFLGLGIDVFGNYASPNFGNSGGMTVPSTGGEVGLRGSGDGCNNAYAQRFHWVGGAPVANLWTGVANSKQDPSTQTNSQYRRVSITVVPTGKQVQVTVAMSGLAVKTAAAGTMTTVFTGSLGDSSSQAPMPATLKLGFSASTGAATDYHDIRNIAVSALTDTSIAKTLATPGQAGYATPTFLPGDPISFTLTATNNGPTDITAAPGGGARVFDNLTNLPITDVAWTCSAGSGAACVNGTSGTGPVVSQEWTGNAGSSVTVTVTGKVTANPGSYTNTATLPTDYKNNLVDPDNPIAQADGATVDTNTGNNTASVGFTVVAPNFKQTKTADKGSYAVGQPITYTIVVTNAGNGAGTATLADMAPAGVAVSNASCVGSTGTICNATVGKDAGTGRDTVSGSVNAPAGGTATFTITGTVTAGPDVTNTATVTVTNPGCTAAICGGGDTTTPNLPVVTPGLSVVKTATVGGKTVTTMTGAGQVITYQFLVTNTGATPMDNITINEGSFNGTGTLAPATCPSGTLAVGASTTCSADYTVTQADVDGGTLTNTATAQGYAPNVTTPTVSDPSSTTLTTAANPVLTLSKNANIDGDPVDILKAGEVITYTFTVKNTGNLTMSGIHVDEDTFSGDGTMSGITCPDNTTLAPTETMDCTATYSVTDTDVDAGTLINTAYAFGKAPGATKETQSNQGKVSLPIVQEPSIDVTKSAVLAGGDAKPHAGEMVNFTISVFNNGNVTLHNFDLTDSMTGLGLSDPVYNWPGTEGILAAGSTMTITANYELTQADIDAGSIANTATVTAQDPDETDTVTGGATVTVPLAPDATMTLVKTGVLTSDSLGAAGDTITYTFEAKNTGNVTLTGVTISDPLPGLSKIAYTWPHTNGEPDGTLAPGESVTGTATYTVTQEDVNAGNVHNDAEVTGVPPVIPGAPTPTPPPDGKGTTDVPLTADPHLTLVKTGALNVDPDSPAFPGDEIDYGFTITNDGNVTLTGVAIADDLPGLSDIEYTWPHIDGEADGTLAPGEQATATATYKLTQADIDNGSVYNKASVTGVPPTNPDGSTPDLPPAYGDVTVNVGQSPQISVVKSGELADPDNPPTVGSKIDYTFTINNGGNVTLTDVNVTDLMPGLSNITYDWPHTDDEADGTMAPGDYAYGHAEYTLTQADIDAGTIHNDAAVTGTPPSGDDVTDEDGTDVDLPAAPHLTLVKTGALVPDSDGNKGFAGDQIEYTFTITNDGNVTLTDVNVTDPMPGLSGIAYTWPHNNDEADGTLAPGETATALAVYTLTQADVDAGTVHNDATVTGTPPDVPATPDNPTPTPTPPPVGNGGTDTPVPPQPALTVHKSATEADGSPVQELVAGDTIYYSFVVNNTGNVTMDDIAIDEKAFSGTGAMSAIDCPAGPLAPDSLVTCTATYVVTQDDVDAGELTNTATGHGTPPVVTPPDGSDPGTTPPVDSPPSTVTVPAVMAPELTVTKKASLSALGTPVQATNVVNYTVTVQNTGNVTLTAITVDDPLTGGDITAKCTWPDGAPDKLIPGHKAACTVQYPLSQANIDAGTVTNIATATGYDPDGDKATGTGNVTTDLTLTPGYGPGLSVKKTADDSGVQQPAQIGDPIVYTVTATNTGDLTLTGVTLTDPMLGGDITGDVTWPATTGTLLPGESVTAVITYKLTQDDIDAGEVTNEAFAQGTPPTTPGNPEPPSVPGGDTVTTDIPSSPGITLEKTGSIATDPAMAGDDVTFDFTATNTGNVTLTSVDIVDEMPGLSSVVYGDWPGGPTAVGVLRPGESVDATATYTLTQTDVDAGNVANSATVTAQPPTPQTPNAPTPPPVDGGDEVNVPVPDAPSLDMQKTAAGTDGHPVKALVAGATVDFFFVVTNTGNVTVSGVEIEEQEFNGTGTLSAIDCPSGPLDPGASVICKATYVVTQDDVDSGVPLSNTAIGTGQPPAQTPPDGSNPPDGGTPTPPPAVDSPPSTVLVPGDPTPGLSLHKTGKLADGAKGVAGDVVNYTFTATNTGNITLKGVTISDQMTGLSDITYDWPGADGVLEPGQQMTATATYTLTQADVDAGGVHNSATVSDGGCDSGTCGDTCSGDATCGDDTTDVPVTARPSLDMVKTATFNGGPATDLVAGQVIDYKFTVTNTGNVTMTGIGITEQKFTGLGMTPGAVCPSDVLAPGATMVCTAKYTVIPDDIAAAQVSNTAVAVGTPPPLNTDSDGNLVLGPCPDCTVTTPTPITSKPSTVVATLDPPAPVVVNTGGSIAADATAALPLGLAIASLLAFGISLLIATPKASRRPLRRR